MVQKVYKRLRALPWLAPTTRDAIATTSSKDFGGEFGGNGYAGPFFAVKSAAHDAVAVEKVVGANGNSATVVLLSATSTAATAAAAAAAAFGKSGRRGCGRNRGNAVTQFGG